MTLEIIVDTREPPNTAKILKAYGAIVIIQKLDYGDLKTKEAIAERKTVADFLQSAQGWAKAQVQGRLWDQLQPFLECEEIPFLAMSGSLTRLEQDRGIQVNRDAFYGALASVMVRYGVSIIWKPTENNMLYTVYKIFEKIHEGKWLQPRWGRHRKAHPDMRVHNLSVLLKVSPRVSENLLRTYQSVPKIFQASEAELMAVEGIGFSTAQKIRYILREGFK